MHDDQLELPETLRSVFAHWKMWNDRGVEVELHSNVSVGEALGFFGIARELQPGVAMEVEFAQEISAQAILAALQANGRGHHPHRVFDAPQCKARLCSRASNALEQF
jgi:hypothetical protein